MKVLVIDEWFPWPLDCGKKIRTFNLTRQLSRDFEILFVAYARLPEDQEGIDRLEQEGIRTIAVKDTRYPKWTPRFYAEVLLNFFSPHPFSSAYHIRHQFTEQLRRLVGDEKPSLIHCEWTNLAPFLKGLEHIPRIIAAHNIESDIWKRLAQNGANPLVRLVGASQAKKIEKLEKYWYPRVECCIAVSSEDLSIIRGYGAMGMLVENGVDVEHYSSFPPATEEKSLVFTASFDTFSNQDGAEFFLREVWPLLKSAHPGLKLWLVGKSPSGHMLNFAASDPAVLVTGRVPDVRDFVARAAVSIVPLRIGGGSRLKILEAMAMKKAVVSTSVGAEGLRISPGKNILIADTPKEFAGAVSRCLHEPMVRSIIGKAGYELVLTEYDWGHLAERQKKVWFDCQKREK